MAVRTRSRSRPSNPYSEAKSRLGRMLFFDPVMSGSGARACAACHNPALSWQDNLPRGIGENQEPMPVRTPTLLNVAWVPKLGWDGHFRDLESGRLRSDQQSEDHEHARERPGQTALRHSRLRQRLQRGLRRRQHHQAQDRTGAGDIRAVDRVRRGAVRPLDQGRRGRHQRGRQAWLRSLQRQGALRRLSFAAGRSPIPRSTTSASRAATTSAAAASFRRRRSCVTPSRRRPCAMSRAARPTCTMARCRRCPR